MSQSLGMKKRATLAVLLAAAILAMARPGVAEDLPPVIRFGGPGMGFGQAFGTGLIAIAQGKGFVDQEFKGLPVKIEWNYFVGTGPAINEAFADGQLDFAQYGSTPGIIARAAGVQTRIIAGGGGSNIYAVARTGLPITTVQDLKGRKVTFQKATILHWAFLKAIAAAGMSPNDVTILDLKTADQYAALAAGSADADFGTNQVLPLVAQGVVKVFYSSKGNPQAVGPNQFVVSADFEKKYPEATEHVVRGFINAAYWLAQDANREEAIRIWAKSGIPQAVVAEDVSGIPFRDQFNPLLDDFFKWQYSDGIAFEKQQKLIRGDVDLAAWIEPKYEDAAIASLGLQNFWPKRNASGLPDKQAAQ